MRYLVLSLVCLAAVIAYVQRTALTVPTKTIQKDLGIDEQQMGLIMGFWFWAYALLQIPAGWITDRFGSKRSLIFFVVVWSLLTGLAGIAGGFLELLFLWSLMGLAQTGLVPGAAKAIGVWFSATGRAFGSGMIAASMGVGAAIGPLVTGALLVYVSWRSVLGIYVLPGVLLALAMWYTIPRRSEPRPAPSPWRTTFVRMATSRSMVLLCTQHFFRAAAMALFFTWFPRYLQETQHVNELESGQLAMWPGIGVVAGGILGGIVSDLVLRRTGNRRLSRQGIAVAGMVGCTLFALAAYFASDLNTIMALITLAAFSATFGGVSGYSTCIDFGGRRVGVVISTMNMCGNIGAGLFPIAVGWHVKRTQAWDDLLLFFVIFFAIDAICWAFLNPRQPLFENDDAPR